MPARPTQRLQHPASPGGQRGSAIITALLVVALAALLVAGLLWRAQVQLRRVESERLRTQAAWIELGAMDWTRLILRAVGDAAPTVDYGGQVWAVPIAETRLSDFLSQVGEVRAEEGAATYLSGQIDDAQSRLNLRDLVQNAAGQPTQIDPQALASYQRLLYTLGLSPQLAQSTALYLGAAVQGTPATSQTTASAPGPIGLGSAQESSSASDAPLAVESLAGLMNVPGYSADIVQRLAPFVVVLPSATPVNVNTASAEVLAAVIPGLSLTQAEALVSQRNQAYFRTLSDLSSHLAAMQVQVPAAGVVDVRTFYFIVHSKVRHERAELRRDTLIYRDAGPIHSTQVVRTWDVY